MLLQASEGSRDQQLANQKSARHEKEPQFSQEEQSCLTNYFKVSFLMTSCKTRRIVICARRITSSEFAIIQLLLLLIVDG